MHFAIILTGGKQYLVKEGDLLKVEKLNPKEGEDLVFDKVLLFSDGEAVKLGKPYLEGASVRASILEQGKDKKKIVFRFKSKTRYKKKKGHRQPFTKVKIEKIIFG
ncbi:MAG: 50S ribosomal protein L21 [Parcubacteria group bacterium]|nr:50S ribosomal protein L21 [Parcubacteria group bacterium]